MKLKEFVQTYWKQLVEIVAGIVGVLLLRDYFQKDLKATLETQETKAKSDVLDVKVEAAATEVKRLEDENARLAKENAERDAELSKATHEEVEAYYNKKK